MVALSNEVLQKLLRHFTLTKEQITYLAGGREDSDGITYTYVRDGKRHVLKISAREKANGIETMAKKLEFARYLGENGVHVACPVPTESGQLFFVEEDDTYYYIASVMDFVEGENPKSTELQKYAYDWGKMTGRMHRLTKQYPIWKNLVDMEGMYGYEVELEEMNQMCRNPIVKQKWTEMRTELSKLDINRDSYGLIHNDNHQFNVIAGANGLTLLDFDCAECQFMIHDLLLPIQGMLFDVSGGMNRPMTNQEVIKRFYDSFLKGYETESHITTYWLDKMELFLNYRRLLLFTVMQGWMEQDEAARNSFLERIQNPVHLEIY